MNPFSSSPALLLRPFFRLSSLRESLGAGAGKGQRRPAVHVGRSFRRDGTITGQDGRGLPSPLFGTFKLARRRRIQRCIAIYQRAIIWTEEKGHLMFHPFSIGSEAYIMWKRPLQEEARGKLRRMLHVEYEFYDYVKQQL